MKLLATFSAVAALTGCGGLLSPASPPGTTALRIDGHPTTSSGDLAYVLSTTGSVYVYTFPGGAPAGQLTGFSTANLPSGICSDASGDVFIASITNPKSRSSTIYEYRHGGTSPIATLSDEGMAFGCAVDPSTGNLAVINGYDAFNPYGNYSSVAVYPAAQGNPTMYYSSSLGMWSGTYDDAGHLYLACTTARRDRAGIAELEPGSGAFATIRVKAAIYLNPGQILPTLQWDGQYFAMTSNKRFAEPLELYRLSIDGHKATVVDSSTLDGNHHLGGSWIAGNTIVGIVQSNGWNGLSVWSYPQGGEPQSRIPHVLKKVKGKLEGVAVSAGS